ncbi:MAG: hypothetical protein ABI208_05820 [Ginsengibacter sp.]|jgi:hypothetical protein
MDFSKLKIGYVPYLNDMSQPGNRRRFPYYAKRKNIAYSIANPSEEYDIVLLTGQANLSEWLIYKKSHPLTKFIFEMTDSTIFPSDPIRTLLKGSGRYLLGKEKALYLDYKTPVRKWLSCADLVICSSRAVKESIAKWSQHIVISLDYLESEYRFLKTNFDIAPKMKLVWEGLGVSLHHLWKFKEVFKEVSSFCELHIITSENFTVWGNMYEKNVKEIVKKLPIETVFHKWEMNTKDQILSNCDLGIIPLNKKNLFAWHKPANKLISFWFCGLPTLVSNTPAYVDFMDDAESKMYCADTKEWITKIKEYYHASSSERKAISIKNNEFVKAHYSDYAIDKVWDGIFQKMDQTVFESLA